MVVSRNSRDARGVVEEITAAGGTAQSFSADVTKRDDMKAMVDATLQAFGAIHVLCANAGMFPSARLESMSEADFDTVMDTNLKGTFLSVQACLKQMQVQKFGRVILTSSITVRSQVTRVGRITARARRAVGIHAHGGNRGGALRITVNAIMPGNIATEDWKTWPRILAQDGGGGADAALGYGR